MSLSLNIQVTVHNSDAWERCRRLELCERLGHDARRRAEAVDAFDGDIAAAEHWLAAHGDVPRPRKKKFITRWYLLPKGALIRYVAHGQPFYCTHNGYGRVNRLITLPPAGVAVYGEDPMSLNQFVQMARNELKEQGLVDGNTAANAWDEKTTTYCVSDKWVPLNSIRTLRE